MCGYLSLHVARGLAMRSLVGVLTSLMTANQFSCHSVQTLVEWDCVALSLLVACSVNRALFTSCLCFVCYNEWIREHTGEQQENRILSHNITDCCEIETNLPIAQRPLERYQTRRGETTGSQVSLYMICGNFDWNLSNSSLTLVMSSFLWIISW